MVMVRQQKRQQAAQRQRNSATTMTASLIEVNLPPVRDSNENFGLVEAENVPSEEVADLATEDDNASTEPEIQDERQDNTYHSLQVTPELLKCWQETDSSSEETERSCQQSSGRIHSNLFL